jgi:pentapeptide repeat protein
MSESSNGKTKFACNCDPDHRSACWPETFPQPYRDTGYCVMHFPGTEKSDEFNFAFAAKLEDGDYDFRGVWFPDELKLSEHSFEKNAVFESATFKALANFSRANFGLRADFTKAVFEEQAQFNSANYTARANFDDVAFKGNANFDRATFRARVGFNSARFEKRASFKSATFHDRTNFGRASFRGGVNFRLSNFKNYVRFEGAKAKDVFLDGSWLDLREIKIDAPELVSFHTLRLRPYWFVEANPSKFDFIRVDWGDTTVGKEIQGLRKFRSIRERNHLLAIAFWYLAVNAEENHRYEEASNFRYMAMNARRESWREGVTCLARLFLSLKRNRKIREKRLAEFKLFCRSFWKDLSPLLWLYWAVSGYGEKVLRALVVLVGILVLFAGLYAVTARDETTSRSRLWRAFSDSARVMTLQKPDPPPPTTAVQVLVTIETILGPVQAALLALAIRRRFMR